MRVKLAARGGFAGGMARPDRVVDSNALDADQAAKLSHAVRAAVAEGGKTSPPRATPDAMTYTITVEDGSSSTSLKSSDADMSPHFAELLDELERLLR